MLKSFSKLTPGAVASFLRGSGDKSSVSGDLLIMKKEEYRVEEVHPNSRFTFIGSITGRGNKKKATYQCLCGVVKDVSVNAVKRGHTISCGCSKFNNPKKMKHGLTNHPLYKIWHSIKERCRNKNDKGYKNYGAKGITMCDEWYNDFKKFYDWCIENGWKKGVTQVDKDVKAMAAGIKPYIYSSEWCSIVSRKENTNNRTVSRFLTHNGKTQTLQAWAEELGIHQSTLSGRINTNGWDVEAALKTPVLIPLKQQRVYAIKQIGVLAECIIGNPNAEADVKLAAEKILQQQIVLMSLSELRQ